MGCVQCRLPKDSKGKPSFFGSKRKRRRRRMQYRQGPARGQVRGPNQQQQQQQQQQGFYGVNIGQQYDGVKNKNKPQYEDVELRHKGQPHVDGVGQLKRREDLYGRREIGPEYEGPYWGKIGREEDGFYV